ncbi:hypothetical protein [Salinispora arenicola]|uniref:hypothetical protein n=1 Tax=Salinispora arenicola TaxID=168697 RepID=UPI0027DDF856|nr:hypothetical protein [Salinispora arenicola]
MATLVSVDGGYLSILAGMLAMGLGMGLTQTPSTEAITSALPRERQGVASALNDVTREFGTALGVALLGAVLTAGYRNAINPRLDTFPTHTADTAREGIANAIDTAGTPAPALIHAAQESFVDGWQQAMWTGVAVMTILFAYVLVQGPQPAMPTTPTTSSNSTSDSSPGSTSLAHLRILQPRHHARSMLLKDQIRSTATGRCGYCRVNER